MGIQGAIGDALKTANFFVNEMKGMKAAIKDTSNELGNVFLPQATEMVSAFSEMIRGLRMIIEENSELISSMGKSAAQLGIQAAKIILVVGASFKLLSAINLVSAAAGHLTVLFKIFASNPAVQGIVALTFGLGLLAKEMGAFDVNTNLGKWLDNMFGGAISSVQKLRNEIKFLTMDVSDADTKAIGLASKNNAPLAGLFRTKLVELEYARETLKKVIKEAAVPIIPGPAARLHQQDRMDKLASAHANFNDLEKKVDGLREKVNEVVATEIKTEFVEKGWDKVKGTGEKAAKELAAFFGDAFKGITGTLSDALDKVGRVGFKEFLNTYQRPTELEGLFDVAKSTLSEALKGTASAWKQLVVGGMGKLKVPQKVADLLQGVAEGAHALGGKIPQRVSGLRSGLGGGDLTQRLGASNSALESMVKEEQEAVKQLEIIAGTLSTISSNMKIGIAFGAN